MTDPEWSLKVRPVQSILTFGELTLTRVGHGFAKPGELSWLVKNIWLDEGTGMLAGPPKTGKTWLILDLAVSIASGTPFLGKFEARQGPVVIYSPEGPKQLLEDRIRQVAERRSLDHAKLEIYIIDANDLFLDDEANQETIRNIVEAIEPKLIIFDPLAECFRGDENRTEDVKVATNFLTKLARQCECASLITHHIVKTTNGKHKGGRIRGSGAWHGFGDCYVYIDPEKSGKIRMEVEQRNGEPAAPCLLELSTKDGATAYAVVHGQENDTPQKQDLGDRILRLLFDSAGPMVQRDIRLALKGSNSSFGPALIELGKAELIKKVGKFAWELTESGTKLIKELGGPVRPSPIGTNRTGP
jgi:AAA domain-containing protein